MSKHMTIINLACTITKLRKWGEAWKHSAESAQAATARMHQANKDLERAKVITDGLVDKLIADRDAAWTERDTQAADHSRQLTEHRAAFGARTEADAKIIAGLREELEGVGKGEGIRKSAERLVQERDALRAEVAELKTQLERLTSWAAKNQAARETLQNEIEKLKSQTPKQHPVKVGEWVKASNGAVAQVLEVHKDWYLIARGHGWTFANCEPCDPPIVKREPTIGDTVRLVKIPIMGAVSPELQRVLEWPWIERWGTLNQTALVVEPAYQLEGALSVCLRTNVHAHWPVCCIEVVSEATHDTEAGKAVAESAAQHSAGIDIGTWSRKVTT